MNHVNVKDLQKLKNLVSFSATQLEKLAANLFIKPFEKNEIVFDQDEEARFIYLSLSGIVRVSYINSHDGRLLSVYCRPESFLGLTHLFRKPITRSDATCLMTAPLGLLNRRLLLKYF